MITYNKSNYKMNSIFLYIDILFNIILHLDNMVKDISKDPHFRKIKMTCENQQNLRIEELLESLINLVNFDYDFI